LTARRSQYVEPLAESGATPVLAAFEMYDDPR
jgi:hypothetical protein